MSTPGPLTATATRNGRWWRVRVDQLDAVGQARTVREFHPVAVEVAALHLGVPESDVDVTVTVHVSEAAEQLWEEARTAEEDGRRALQRAAELRREAVRSAREDGYRLDATAAAFGVTPSRIQQLAAAAKDAPKR
jgi:DNA-directed RNA polymerase specialized sigma24 family protein